MIDSHAHINDEILYTRYDEIIRDAKDAGVNKIIIPGWDVESSIKAIEIAKKYDGVYAAVGIHPENIDSCSLGDINKIKELAKDDKVICIGEIGMDYHYTKENSELQKEFFIRQLDLAKELNLPVEIHLRDCVGDFMDLIRNYIKTRGKRENIGVMHSFSESVEIMNELISYGFYISLSGPVTFKNARVQKEVAKAVRLDRLLTETDSPYLSPHPLRGTINEPKNIPLIVKEISSLKEIDESIIEKAIEDNFDRVFNLKGDNLWV